MPEELMNSTPKKKAKKVEVVSIKGPEFLMPVKGYYCSLCKEFCGDEVCGEFHLKTDTHYTNYLEYLKKNVFYEQRRKLDKVTGIAQRQEKEREKKELHDKLKTRKDQVLDQLIKDKIKLSEKPVQELPDMDETPRTVAKQAKIKLSLKKSTDEIKTYSEKSEPSNAVSQEKVEENSEDSSKKDDSKKQISIKISNKMGIVGKVPAKKNPLLAPWTPVSKQEVQKPPTLEKFLSIEGGKTKSIPLVNTKKPMVTAQDILNAFSGKSKDTNPEVLEEGNEVKFGPHLEVIEPEGKGKEDAEVKVDKPNPKATSKESQVAKSNDLCPSAEDTHSKMITVRKQEKFVAAEDTKTGEENIETASVLADNNTKESNKVKSEESLPSEKPDEACALDSDVNPCTAVNQEEEEKSLEIDKSNNVDIFLKREEDKKTKVDENVEDVMKSFSDTTEETCSKSETNNTVQNYLDQNVNDSSCELNTQEEMELDVMEGKKETAERCEDDTQLPTNEINLKDIVLPPDDAKADSDAESDGSGISMHIGSDFEVIDECEED